jgi:lysophospholipase L1-like esterase
MKIVCFGDSLTACGGEDGRFSDILQDRFPEHVFVNRGAGGESFVEARERLESDCLTERPDVVLLEFGANDWWRDERPYADWATDLEDFVRRIKGTGAEVVVLGVFGAHRNADGMLVKKTAATDERAEAYQRLEQEIASKYKCEYVPNIQEHIIGNRCCWRDRNHPNEYGNR